MMSRRDYEAVAGAFRLARQNVSADDAPAAREIFNGVALAEECVATALISTNPNFDRTRFIEACRREED